MIIDTTSSLGFFPFRQLRHTTPEDAARIYAQEGIDCAFVSPLEGICYRNPHEINLEFIRSLKEFPMFIPVAVINPKLKNWSSHLDACIRAGAKAIKLYPSYHSYAFSFPPLTDLMQSAGDRSLPVMIPLRVEDPRGQHPRMIVPDLDLYGMAFLPGSLEKTTIILTQIVDTIIKRHAFWLKEYPNIHIACSHYDYLGDIDEFLDVWYWQRALFGTHFPFFYLESNLRKFKGMNISPEVQEAVFCGNARKLFDVDFDSLQQTIRLQNQTHEKES